MMQTIAAMRPLLDRVERRGRALADQLRRAASSVALNLAEGDGVAGGNRTLRRRTALGSLYEVRSGLEVAVALGYLAKADAATAEHLAWRVGGMLYRLVNR